MLLLMMIVMMRVLMMIMMIKMMIVIMLIMVMMTIMVIERMLEKINGFSKMYAQISLCNGETILMFTHKLFHPFRQHSPLSRGKRVHLVL